MCNCVQALCPFQMWYAEADVYQMCHRASQTLCTLFRPKVIVDIVMTKLYVVLNKGYRQDYGWPTVIWVGGLGKVMSVYTWSCAYVVVSPPVAIKNRCKGNVAQVDDRVSCCSRELWEFRRIHRRRCMISHVRALVNNVQSTYNTGNSHDCVGLRSKFEFVISVQNTWTRSIRAIAGLQVSAPTYLAGAAAQDLPWPLSNTLTLVVSECTRVVFNAFLAFSVHFHCVVCILSV